MLNTGTKYPAVQLVKGNTDTAALLSKMVKSRLPADVDIAKPASHYQLNQGQLQAISDKIKSRIRDNENITQLFPDIELAIQILVSSILSPKDMIKTEIIYRAEVPILPPELLSKLNSEVKKHLEGHYHIKDDLPEILRDTLFEKGSYVKAVIPESVVDEIINGNTGVSTEAISEILSNDGKPVPLGILGSPGPSRRMGTAMERFRSDVKYTPDHTSHLTYREGDNLKEICTESLDITDNFRLLKLPLVNEAMRKERIRDIISPRSMSMESAKVKKITDLELSEKLYKSKDATQQTMLVVPKMGNAKRKSVGRPLVMRLPSESVIPVYMPGNATNHIGYFVLTDIDGNPVTVDSNQDHIDGLGSAIMNQNQSQSLSSMLISKAKRNLTDSVAEPTIDQITRIYGSIVEKDLMDRLKNGIYGQDITVGDNNEIYQIMLARALANMYTRLIYVPGELVGYFAFKYFNNGVGKSYLDDIKILSSLRAIMMFAKVMAMTKNSIALTHVNITLDPNDPDPQKTLEMSTHEIVRLRQQYFPLGINSPVDLVDWIQRAGFEFSFEGHPGLPQTKFDFETKNLQHTVPDSDLDELLRKQTYMAFGLSPETIDNGFNSEFATTVVSNNILLSKRVIQLQSVITKQLSTFVRKVILNDSFIKQDLMDVLVANKGLVEKSLTEEEQTAYASNGDAFMIDVMERYVEQLYLDLPKPDVTSIETQIAAFDQYKESLEKTIDSWINSEFITSDLVGDISGNVDSVKAVVKNYFLRKWMSENGFMAELSDIVSADEDGQPTMDIYALNKNHSEGLIRSCLKYIKSLAPIKAAADQDLANMGVEEGTSTDTSEESSDTGDEFGGGEDFGMEEPEAEPEEAPAASEEGSE